MSTIILSCTTLLECVDHAQRKCGTAFPVIELDRKYHSDPAKMREHIISTLSRLPDGTDTVLAAMGFCGGSWQNVACPVRLVIPRVADCVALALTTVERYSPDLKEAGHMYLFGEGRTGFSIRAIYDSLLEQYDRDTADIIFGMYFENYRNVDIIDNGLYDCYSPDYVERAQAEADSINAELNFVPGSNVLLEALVSGQWDARFLVVPPGTGMTQGLFYD